MTTANTEQDMIREREPETDEERLTRIREMLVEHEMGFGSGPIQLFEDLQFLISLLDQLEQRETAEDKE